jgi:ribosomal protein L9
LAEQATPAKLAAFQQKQVQSAQKSAANAHERAARVMALDGQRFEISVPANEKGHLYQKLDARKLGALIPQLPVEAMQLDQPIKETGETTVRFSSGNISANVTIIIKSK